MEHPNAPQPADWDDDRSDAPMSDPGAGEAVRFAGCSMAQEIELLEVRTNS